MALPRFEAMDQEYAAILKEKSPAERIAMVLEANRMGRILAECGVRYLHPEWSDEKVGAEVARRMLHGADRD